MCSLIAAVICRSCQQTLSSYLESLLQTTNTTELYCCILEHVLSVADAILPSGGFLVRQVIVTSFTFNITTDQTAVLDPFAVIWSINYSKKLNKTACIYQ